MLIVGSQISVMRLTYALLVSQQNLILLSGLYTEPFAIVKEIVFHHCTTPSCHKINLFKPPFRNSRFEFLNDVL